MTVMHRLPLALALFLAAVASPARTYQVEDLLLAESYGQIVAAEVAGQLLVERRRPYRQAPDFGYGSYFNDRTLGRILTTPLASAGTGLLPLFDQEEDAGYWMGSLSPSGRRLSVFRLRARILTLGIVDLRTREVRWLDLRPDLPTRAPAPIWIDDDRLLVVERTDGELPRLLSLGSAGAERLARLDAKQSRGGGSFTFSRTTHGQRSATTRLSVIGIDTPRRSVLVEGDFTDLALSPDRRSVAAVTLEEQKLPPPTPIGVSFQSRRLRARTISIDDGEVTSVVEDVAPGVLDWSREGSLLLVARHANETDWAKARVVRVGGNGEVRRLGEAGDTAYVTDPAEVLRFQAGWAGSVALAKIRHDGEKPGWRLLSPTASRELPVPASAMLSTRGSDVVLSSGATDWIIGASGAIARPTTRERLSPISLDPFAAGRETTNACDRREERKGSPRRERPACGGGAAPAEGDTVVAVYADGMIVRRIDPDGVQTLVSLTVRHGPIVVDRVNGHLAGLERPSLRRLETIDRAGRRLIHWLLLPYRPAGGSPPLVVQPYPGRTFDGRAPGEVRPDRQAFATNPLLLVGAGFAVLLPSMPRAAVGRTTDEVVPQVEAAVAAARATGLVRPGPYGVMGHSFGAWAAMVLATGNDCLAGVVAANGVYDMSAAHATMAGPDRIDLPLGVPYGSSAGWAETGQGSLGVMPWRSLDAYVSASPVYRPDRTSTEVLLVGADLDPVDLGQTERMFMELGRSGGDARMLRFWGEGHSISSPGNIRAYWSAAISHLRTGAARSNSGRRCGSTPSSPPSFPQNGSSTGPDHPRGRENPT